MKKVLSLILVAVLAIGMSASAFAAWTNADPLVTDKTPYKITGFADGKDLNSFGMGGTATASDNIRPQDEVVVKISLLDSDNFVVVNRAGDPLIGDAPTGAEKITKQLLSRGKVSVRTSYSKGKECIKEVILDGTDVKVKFKKEYTSTKDLDFEFTVYLTFDSKGDRADGINFIGTYANDVEDYDKDTDYIYMADQIIAKATEGIRGVELDLGEGVKMVDMRLTSGKKYYGVAWTETTDSQEDRIREHGFSGFYELRTVGLSTTGNYIKFEDLDRNDYIYGYQNGEYTFLGMGNQLMPYYSEYYISSVELDIGGAAEAPEAPDYNYDVEPEIEDPAELTPPGGGDDDVSENINYNPSTGA